MHHTLPRHLAKLLFASLLVAPLFGCPPIEEPPPAARPDVSDAEVSQEPDTWIGPDGREDVDPDTGLGMTDSVQTGLLLSPDGVWVVAKVPAGESACVQVLNLDTEVITPFDQLCDVRWLAFSPDSSTVFVLDGEGTAVHEIALPTLQLGPVHSLRSAYAVLTVSLDGGALALANTPTTQWAEAQYELHTYDLELRTLAVIDRESGQVTETLLPYAIRDLDFSPVDGTLVITMSWWQVTGLPQAVVQFWDVAAGRVTDVLEFSNCAADLEMMPEGPYALLSPNRCFTHGVTLARPAPPTDTWNDLNGNGWDDDEEWTDAEWDENWQNADPISIIDLRERTFLGNTPGFGPLALSPVEGLAVGFTRLETMMMEWNFFQEQSVGLIFVELSGFDWQVVELGDFEPHNFFAPDGQTILVYTGDDPLQKLRMVDVATKTVHEVTGPQVDPTEHVWADGSVLYVVANGELFRAKRGQYILTPVGVAGGISLLAKRPGGGQLVLGHSDTAAVHVFDVETQRVVRSYFE